MYCPRCSKVFSEGTSYCRSCGLSLDGVAEIVSGEAETAPELKFRPNDKIMRLGIAVFILGLVVALGNAALAAAFSLPEVYGKVIFLSCVAFGMLLLGAGFVFPKQTYTKRSRRSLFRTARTAPLDELPSADRNIDDFGFSTGARETVSSEPGSVTDHTTRRLG